MNTNTRFALLLVLVLAACQPTISGPAITKTGLLTANVAVDETISGPAQEHHWVFAGDQGDVASILFRSDGNRAALTLRNPDGSELRRVQGGAYQNTIQVDSILPTAGNYAVVVAMEEANSSAYRLILQDGSPSTAVPMTPASPATASPLPAQPTVTPQADLGIIGGTTALPPQIGSGARLTSHQPILGEIADIGSSERYTIVGQAGDVVTVRAQTLERSNLNPHLTIYAPSGDILAENDNAFGTLDAMVVGLSLPVSGAYVVFVRDSAGLATGAYELTFGFGLTARNQVQAPTTPDTAASGLLNMPATQDAWPVELNIGDIISAAVVVDESSGLDPVLSLVSPGGQIIYTDDNSGGGRNAALREIIAPATGEFYLTIAPATADSFGAYTLIWRYDAQAAPSTP